MEDAPGRSNGLGASALEGIGAREFPSPKGNVGRGVGPAGPPLKAVGLSFICSMSEGEKPFFLGLEGVSPILGDDSFEGNLGVKE